ncbi:hypothetical protein [Aquimarina aquimarini]|uniref:hypothetical protein n=1 Tax=Aquimarina aquimarini TaxID=1191734 RepID=UPI000D54EFF7|nr:hypothetical protein [Aquimarina aquimarini]
MKCIIILFILLSVLSCNTTKKINRIEGHIYLKDSTTLNNVQVYYPLKIDRASWIYNELAKTDESGFFSIKNSNVKKSKWISLNKAKDSIKIYLSFTKNKDIKSSVTKKFPVNIEITKSIKNIIDLGEIYMSF